jgi:signal transduction histidine kinase
VSRRAQRFAKLRAELPALLSLTLAIFVLLAGFALLSHRVTVRDLVAERRAEALRLASRLAEEARRGGEMSAIDRLAALAPPGVGVALLDEEGHELAARGYDSPADLPSPGGEARRPFRTFTFGPDEAARDAVIALVPVTFPHHRGFLRVDLPAATLAARARTLSVATPIVLALSASAAVLLLIAGRALVRPYEELLARARSSSDAGFRKVDESELLLAAFDRALAELAGEPSSDLASFDETLGRGATSAFLLLGPDGAVLAANDVAVDLLGLRTPVAGRNAEDLLAEHRGLVEILARARELGVSIPRAETRVVSRETELTLTVVVEALRRAEGGPRGWLVLLADVTDLERGAARDRLAESLAQLGELSAGVAHELRNGLATLSGYLDLARRRPVDDGTSNYLREAALEIRQLQRVVEDFLLFARPGTRRLDRLDLRVVVERAARDPALAGTAVQHELPETPCPVEGDAHLLETALRNLLLNAAQAAGASGTSEPVAVGVEREPGNWIVTVADRGPGLPPGDSADLFEPFHSGRRGGVGLGLAISRRIVLLHGGSIGLAARPGGGAIARVALPRADTFATKGIA